MIRSAVLALAIALGPVARADDAPAPVVLHKGDPAPADGVFLVPDVAATIAARCKADADERDALRKALDEGPSGVSMQGLLVVSGVTLVLGVVVGVVAVEKLKK